MSEEISDNEVLLSSSSSRKRKSYGRMKDVAKKLRLSTHETGADCKCLKLKCFENINKNEQEQIILTFNKLPTYDEQSSYLCGLISCKPVLRHRPRKCEAEAEMHSHSYSYKVRILRDNKLFEIDVCYKAFLSLHGITAKRLQTLQKGLKATGTASRDGRGRHFSRPNKLSDKILEKVNEHILSFKGRNSHYSLSKCKKIFLPAELNVKKMYSMYTEKYPNHVLSYEKYREIFNTNFNISFGYPRSDTCSFCDEVKVKVDGLQAEINTVQKDDITKSAQLNSQLKALLLEKQLHLKKAETFYKRKRSAKYEAQKHNSKEAIVMDFQKNLQVPNITTNDIYYKRQLSFYLFNIHVLSNSDSFFYTYPETCGKKGADDVASMLWDFLFNHLSVEVEELKIFCDSCCGQNKNFTIFRMLHYIVHQVKRLKTVRVIFPIRGHSYLECDRNMGIINQKSLVELPNEWNIVIEDARKKPGPYKVIPCDDQLIFRSWTNFLSRIYFKKCPFASRPIRELSVTEEHPRMIIHRDTYNGHSTQTVILPPKRKVPALPEGQFHLPLLAYEGKLPISRAKYEDLQHLKTFCREEAQEFFVNLPFENR